VSVYPHEDKPRPFADYHDYVRLYDKRVARFPESLSHDEVAPLSNGGSFRSVAYHRSIVSFEQYARKELDYFALQKREFKRARAGLWPRAFAEFPFQFVKYYFGRRHVFGGFYGFKFATLAAFMRWVRVCMLLGD
jgi:hypothetical protein